MILIISQDQEITTTEVIRWLTYMNKKFIRVNDDENFSIRIINKRFYLESHKHSFFLDEITSFWYRRGELKFKRVMYSNKAVNIHMQETQYWLEDYIIKTLESKKHINKQSNCHVNKLLVLERALFFGLNVPNYYLAENTNDVLLNKTIIKSINGNVALDNISKNKNGIMYTNLVEKKMQNNFFCTFFQDKIDKEYEIRTFYFNGKIWSFAIFSQNDDQTKLDFRRYNWQNPNRNIIYQLPKKIETQIDLLMKDLDLNCGSLDFIKSKDNYYFLEVNPVGQFSALSYLTNSYIEREIAEYL